MIGFSAMMSAVKPKERTDQYSVLAAMFVLRAHEVSVTARQVSDILKLHLGAKAPTNVPGCLRKYTTYAAPTDKGPPLLWTLTGKGIEHLRSLTGLSLPTASETDNFKSD